LWHIDPLLGNDHETNNETTVNAGQQLRKYAAVMETLLGRGPFATMEVLLEAVFFVVRSEAISLDRPSSFQLVQYSAVEWSEFVGELVRGLLRFSCCELLLLEAGS
jgi:hypothetical protein